MYYEKAVANFASFFPASLAFSPSYFVKKGRRSTVYILVIILHLIDLTKCRIVIVYLCIIDTQTILLNKQLSYS